MWWWIPVGIGAVVALVLFVAVMAMFKLDSFYARLDERAEIEHRLKEMGK